MRRMITVDRQGFDGIWSENNEYGGDINLINVSYTQNLKYGHQLAAQEF